MMDENIGGIVCLNEPHETDHEWVAKKSDWESRGIKYYWLPVPDFMFSPSHWDIDHAVKFIREIEDTRKSVYVHCKAGRTRSATVVAGYLMQVIKGRNGNYVPIALFWAVDPSPPTKKPPIFKFRSLVDSPWKTNYDCR